MRTNRARCTTMSDAVLSLETSIDPSLTEKAKRRIEKKRRKRERGQLSPEPMKPGVVYIGHIPHGFYEAEMKAYFTQFGEVKRVNMARSKKTGRSKGYAFVQFACDEVAKIVAQTMNNYLMFNKLLKCQYIEPAQVHRGMITRRRRRLKEVRASERLRLAQQKHNQGRNMSQHRRRLSKLLALEKKKREKLKAIGIDYEFPGYAAAVEATKEHEKPIHIEFKDDYE